MRRWIVWSVLGLGVVAALLLPPSPERFIERVSSSSTIGAMTWAVRGEYQTLAETLWLDTIAARAALDGGMVLAGLVTRADSVTSDDPYALVRAELDAFGVAEPRVRVGAFWFERELANGATAGMGGMPLMLLDEGDHPYCFVPRVRGRSRFWASLDEEPTMDLPVLQACSFYARYGVPGPQVSRWLRAGALGLAVDPLGQLRSSAGEMLYAEALPGRVWRGRWEVAQAGCAGGRMDVCAAMFLAPGEWERGDGPVASYGPVGFRTTAFGPNRSAVLGDLAREFGDERFEAFWSSSLPVPEAFRAAFGVSHAEWTRTWLLDEYGPVTLGARMSAGTVVLTLLGIAFWAGIGVATARRRRVA
ncbi:MAG: hypothetical protein R3E98_12710 [Gemmatimonadota bacterium]|nr:hypothetical protein [Gemmatimonadota bacterium]